MKDWKGPADFQDFIGKNRAVVCGQAVNLWALFFHGRGQYLDQLRPLEPFVSHDIDLLGDEATFAELRAFGKWTMALRFKAKPGERVDLVGALEAEQPDGSKILVEVRRHILGLNDDDLNRLTSVNIGESDTFYLMECPYVMKGKIMNYIKLPQTTPGSERQDAKHIRILIPCIHGYITNAAARYSDGSLDKADFLRLLRDTGEILGSESAHQVSAQLGVDFSYAIPAEILSHPDEEIRTAVEPIRSPGASLSPPLPGSRGPQQAPRP